jgi:glycine/D-amino acid oxidase-like deaminating enzyme
MRPAHSPSAVTDSSLSLASQLPQELHFDFKICVDPDMTIRCNSYYTATLNHDTDYPTLQGRHKVDVVIIGGGFTGVATAVELAEKGLKVAIIESHKIGWGATGRNGGQVTGSLSGDGAMRKQMRAKLGDDVDDFIWHLRWRGHEIIRQRVEKYAIQCDLKHGHLHAAYKPSHMVDLRKDYDEAVRRGLGDEVSLLDRSQVRDLLQSELYHGAIKNTRNMHLHPLNLCIGEARAAESLGALIFENSEVLEIIHGDTPGVRTAHGQIDANQVMLAGDVYHKLEPGQLKGKIFRPWAASSPPRRSVIWRNRSTPKTSPCTTAASSSITTGSPPTAVCCSAAAPTTAARIRATSLRNCARVSNARSRR